MPPRSTTQLDDQKLIRPAYRPWVLAAIFCHLAILATCWLGSNRQSPFGASLLGFLTPYITTFNLRMDLQPMAVTDPLLLELPIAVRFGDSRNWIDWMQASRTVDGSAASELRRKRYLRQLTALIDFENEDGVAKVVAAMLADLKSNRKATEAERFQIVRLPRVEANEWAAAKRFEATGELPIALEPQVVLSAKIITLADGTPGILPDIDSLRTVPPTATAK